MIRLLLYAMTVSLAAKAQTASRLSQSSCTNEWNSFYDQTPEAAVMANESSPPGLLVTLLSLTQDGYSNVLGEPIVYNVIDALQNDTSGLIAISSYNSFLGNRSLEDLAKQKLVEPILTNFTKRSRPVKFDRLENGTYTATDLVGRTLQVRDTYKVACNTRVLLIDSILLPASNGLAVPRFTASKLMEIANFLGTGVNMAPAPAPAPAPSSTARLADLS